MTYRLLDLFCGAGGAAMGYHRAGFEIVGVDHKPQKHYPFTFVLGDALEYCAEHGAEFDAIHASPPCQRYSVSTPPSRRASHPDLVAPTRKVLRLSGRPYVIENVPGAPVEAPFMLCGTMFGLVGPDYHLRRHRLFEAPWWRWLVPACYHWPGPAITITGHGWSYAETRRLGRHLLNDERKLLMGIDWTNRDELSQAVPPAYTYYIGCRLLEHLHK